MSRLVKHEQMKLSVPQNIGTLKGVAADHWKQETPVYHYLLLISACFFCFFITVEDVLFKKYCLRSTVIPQARKKNKKNIHIQTCTHVYQLVYLLYFENLKYWRLQVGCLQVHHCFMLRYFMEVLLFNIMMQLYLLFEHCFPVMFLQPTRVINSKCSCPR